MAETKFRQIAARLADEIRSLPPGTRIPSEHDIGARFGVGRAAARAAVQDLERQALVRRVKGRGTFRSVRVDYVISSGRPPSWSQTLRAAGAVPHTVVRACDTVEMPREIAERLRLDPDTPCYRLQRRSFTNDLPASWGTEWIPCAVVPELGEALRHETSLDRILRDLAEVEPARGPTRASMEAAPDQVADELALEQGAPVWLVESVNLDRPHGVPLYLTQRWIRADAVRVILETGAD